MFANRTHVRIANISRQIEGETMTFCMHRGRTISYRLLGQSTKPLLVLAHPLGMTQGIWDEMLPALLEAFQVLTWDLPGHGASSAWPEDNGAIEAEDLAQEAITLRSEERRVGKECRSRGGR